MFRIHLNDHLPAHVHAVYGAGVAVIELGGVDTPPAIREFYGLKLQDVRRALAITLVRQEALIEAWRRIHGS